MPSTIILSDNGASSGSAGLKQTAGNDGTLLLQTTTSGGTATTAVTIDTSQNMGLGVTPSAWSATWKAFQTTGGSVVGSTSNIRMAQNWYHDGTSRYVASRPAAMFVADDGTFAWYTAASGTAGNAITFTQAMTLNASGFLGIGQTSPTYSVDVLADTGNLLVHQTRARVIDAERNIGGIRGGGYSTGTTIVDAAEIVFASTGAWSSTSAPSYISFATTPSGSTTLAERARIKAAGEIASASAGDFGIRTAVTAGAGTTTGIFVGARSATAGNTNSGTDTFIVWSNGNVVNTNNSYGAISDIKLKENITDTTPKLADLMQVRVRNYNLKNAPEQKQLGVIAQELEQVFPSMVDESPDRDVEGNDLGTTTKQVKYSVFVPMLIKAMQEQQAIITQLQADVAALKGAQQ